MRPKKRISYSELISLVPDTLLDSIAKDTNVDFSVSKLTGKNMFSLLLYGLTCGTGISLRLLESAFNSDMFQALSGGKTIRHSGIGDRLAHMNVDYFKRIFDHLCEDERVDRYMGIVQNKYAIKKIDSTIVTLSAKLLKTGMRINKATRDLKFSTALTDGLPTEIVLFTNQTYASENKALKEVIELKRAKHSQKITILIFDRGIHSKDTFDEITKTANTHFITRLSGQSYKILKIHKQVKGKRSGKLILQRDAIIHFESSKEKGTTSYRLITAINKDTRETYQFLTNILFLNASEICEMYKSRWEIEVFFKFLKQQLKFKHLVSRKENGIKIMMYMTMIAAILVAIYKKINKIEGWLVAQLQFVREMEAYVLKHCFEFLAPLWGFSKKSVLIYDTS